jgi:flagellar protein FlaJ
MILTAFLVRLSVAITYVNELALLAILIVVVPSAVLDFWNQRWVDTIENQMPSFVRGISESQATGATITAAMDSVVQNKIVRHPLADEVKKISVQMSWGISFEEALRRFRDRIGILVVSRFTVLVLEASRSGGEIGKVFQATSGFMEGMKEIDSETDSEMRPYIMIVYTAFFVFLFVALILVQSFFMPLEGSQQILSTVTIVGVREFKDFFYRTMLVSALMGGLMAGKIGERRVLGGLKHSIIMLVAGYIIFFLTIPPNWMVI